MNRRNFIKLVGLSIVSIAIPIKILKKKTPKDFDFVGYYKETYTFLDVENDLRFTVHKDFLMKLNKPITEYRAYDLISQHQMGYYLHNPYGPTLLEVSTGKCEYFINGKIVEGFVC